MPKRRSPIRHPVKGHYRQGKWIESFERGRGKRPRRSRRVGVVTETRKIEIKGDAPIKTKSRVQRILSNLPKRHTHDLNVEFKHRDDDFMFHYHGMHGRYVIETKTLLLQPLKSLKNRTVYHDVGHHVYNTLLTLDKQKQWEKISRNEADRLIPSWIPKPLRPEEYFAELYCSRYTKSALISGRFAPVEITKFMDSVLF